MPVTEDKDLASGPAAFTSRQEHLDSRNILRTLFHREIGFRYSPYGKIDPSLYDVAIQRQLLVARCKDKHGAEAVTTHREKIEETGDDVPNARPETGFPTTSIMFSGKSIRISHSHSKSRLNRDAGPVVGSKAIGIYEKIFLRLGTDFTCFTPGFCGAIRANYKITALGNWRDWNTFSPNYLISGMKRKISPLICCLSNKGDVFNAYDLHTGKKFCGPICLDKEIKFGTVEASEEMDRVILSCVRASLPDDLIFDCILLDVLNLRNTIRVQIKKTAIRGKKSPTGITVTGNVLLLHFSNSVQMWDFCDVLNSSANCDRDDEGRVSVSHVVSNLSAPLAQLPKSDIDFAMNPPHYITNRTLYDTSTQRAVPVVGNQSEFLNEIQRRVAADAREDHSVEFHPDATSRVIFCTQNRLCVALLKRTEGESGIPLNSYLVEEFHVKFVEAVTDSVVSRITIAPSRVSTRVRRQSTKYGDMLIEDSEEEIVISYEWLEHLSAFVIMEACSRPPHFKFHYYDSTSWNKIITIHAITSVGRKQIPVTDLMLYSFSVTDAEIIIMRTQGNTGEVFVVSLLDEVKSLVDPTRRFATSSLGSSKS